MEVAKAMTDVFLSLQTVEFVLLEILLKRSRQVQIV